MKIGICAEMIGTGHGGPESYIFNLVKSLMELDKENVYNLYVVRKDVLKNINVPCNFRASPIGLYNSWIRNLIIMPFKSLIEPVDILHVQNVVHPCYRGKLIATIHDLSFEIFPETFTKAMQFRLSKLVRRTASKADAVLTVSQNTKKDLINLYGIRPEKIEVIYNSHDRIYRPVKGHEMLDTIKRKYGLIEKFILYVGALQPRKNLVGLIKAWDILRKKYGLKIKLVVVGKEAWLSSEIMKAIKNIKYSQDIIYTGYIPKEELPFVFNAADLFVFPSFYEGFGLVVLEAMACGIPVITSNNSSLPEVVGDAGMLIDPNNCEEIAEAMYKVLAEPELKESMIEKGMKRSESFSWKYTAEKTLEIYHKIGNS